MIKSYAPVICNHGPLTPREKWGLTFRLRGQTVGRTTAICPSSLLWLVSRYFHLKPKTPALARHCGDDAKVKNLAHFPCYPPPCPGGGGWGGGAWLQLTGALAESTLKHLKGDSEFSVIFTVLTSILSFLVQKHGSYFDSSFTCYKVDSPNLCPLRGLSDYTVNFLNIRTTKNWL